MITQVLELRIVVKMGCMLEEDSWMVRKDNKTTARDRVAKNKTGRLSSAGSRLQLRP